MPTPRARICVDLFLVLLFATMIGCGSDRNNILPEETVVPRPPAFLVGPAGALFTNANSYSARLAWDHADGSNKISSVAGQLLSQGPCLLFAPEKGNKVFIWNVAEHNGYILSEALQGYAPISSPSQITNVLMTSEIAGPASERVNGHPGHSAEISVAANDNSIARFTVWLASDLSGMPLRIKTLTASVPFEINLWQIHWETFPSNLFQPPEGFSKYANPEAMTSELLMRKSKLRNPAINNNPNDVPSFPQHKTY